MRAKKRTDTEREKTLAATFCFVGHRQALFVWPFLAQDILNMQRETKGPAVMKYM